MRLIPQLAAVLGVTPLGPLDRGGRRRAPQLDPRLSAPLDQELDQVGVEPLEWTGSAVDDDRGTAGTRADVGELEGDEATPDEQDPRRSTSRSKKSVLSTRCS